MTYADQQGFYSRVRRDHPHQAGYNADAYTTFLRYAGARLPLVYVLEFGGWTGGLARLMLERNPLISVWCNVEICPEAIAQPEFQSPRYAAWMPRDFAWKVELPPANVVVASHFIEHVRRHQLELLLANLPEPVRFIGLQAPIPESTESQDWTGYHGAHILEVGWKQVEAMLAEYGFAPVSELRDATGIGEYRAYER